MVGRFIDAATGRVFRDAIKTLQEDTHRELHTDRYVLWTVTRPRGIHAGGPSSWEGGAREVWTVIGEGTCALRGQGPGGPQVNEAIVNLQSPFEVRMLADAFDGLPRKEGSSEPDTAQTWLVINETRLFAVQSFKRESERDELASAFVTEVFDRPLPVEGGRP